MGLRNITIVGEFLQYYCPPVCGSLTEPVWDFILSGLCPSYHLAVASSLSLEMGYLYGGFQCPPVKGCSTASCKLIGGDDNMAFYFTILNWKVELSRFQYHLFLGIF